MTYHRTMDFIDNQLINLSFAGILGLCVGSFLNVAIHRIPLMKSVVQPRSHCAQCEQQLPIWANIPILSYLYLGGISACCERKISLRYPLIELLCTVLTLFVIYQYGLTIKSGLILFFTWSLIVLVFIDIEHMILPDRLTLPLIWIGLLANTQHIFTTTSKAIFGATLGYSLFWAIGSVFKRLRGIDGLGRGDYKLLAMLGAWLGWESLPLILLFSSTSGLFYALGYHIFYEQKFSQPIPFGPFLGLAGLISMYMVS